MHERVTSDNSNKQSSGTNLTKFEKGCAIVSGTTLGLAVSATALPVVIGGTLFTGAMFVGIVGAETLVHRNSLVSHNVVDTSTGSV